MRWWPGIVVGSLLLVTVPEQTLARVYKGGEYRTRSSFLYGRFEARIKTNGREGMLTSLFTYNDNYPTTAWNEIDIEIMGRYADDVQFNTITPGQVHHVSHQYVDFNPALGYHVYGFEWTPTYVAWFIDDVEVYRQTGSYIAELNLPQKLMMNAWLPTYANWAGQWNDVVLPAFAYYDWVKYASYTPGTGTYGTDNNFTPQWTDDFDTWDQARWDKATHTFNGNNCDFLPANIVFQDGKMILCLTKETAIGYVDNVPPAPLWARVERNTVRVAFAEEVERASAEATSSYLLSNLTVASARLLGDLKTLVLNVPGIDTSSVSNLIVMNVRDLWSTPNTLPPSAVPLIRATPLTFPVKINVGGGAYQGYLPDQNWTPATEYGRMDGQASYFDGVTITNTSDPEIYRSELYDLVKYNVRVPNGQYLVSMMMTENYFQSTGKRLFRIVVEGNPVEGGLDLYFRVGFRTAYQKAVIAQVTDGLLEIHMQGLVDKPLLNGLVITSLTDVDEKGSMGGVPGDLLLEPNYPNPFNGGTKLRFSLSYDDKLTLKVYDTLGRIVSEELLGEFLRGNSEVVWEARSREGAALPTGVYFYRLEGATRSALGKFVYLK